MYPVWEWAPGLGLFLSWFSFGASELGSPGVSGTSALTVTVRCLVQGLRASCHCAVVWNTQHTCLKTQEPIKNLTSLLCILEADILHVSFGIIQSCASSCLQVTGSPGFNEELGNAMAKSAFSSFSKSFNYGLILTFFGFTK